MAITPILGVVKNTFSDSPNLTGFVGINNSSAGASLDVGALTYNPGTIAVTGTTVTGTSTSFTKTFAPGQSITTTTTSGSETKEIQTISSDTAMTTVSAFAGTNSAAVYTASASGSQFHILPNGGIRIGNTMGLSTSNSNNTVYKADTITISGSQVFNTIRDQTQYNQSTTASGTVNSYSAGIKLNATGSGSFGAVRGINSFPTVLGTNTGNITTLTGALVAPTIDIGTTGTITNIVGVNIIGTNSSSTNTVTNHWGLIVNPVQAAGTLTSYAGITINAKPTAATNSSLLLIGTTAIPTGSYSIYNISTLPSLFTGDIQFGKTVTAAATTGDQVINKTAGTVNFATAATSLVVTNSLVTANSIIICTVGTVDTTMKSVVAVAGSGSFTLTSNAAATAETRVNFLVIN